MNKQWMALLLSTGIAVTASPVPAAQMPPAEQIHGEAEETSVPVQHDDSDDRETANEFQSDTEPSQSETDDGAAGNEEENNEAGEEKLDIPAMISCIQEAAALEEIDLSSETVSKFFLASDTYEKIMAHLADKDIRIVVDATRDLLVNVLKYHPFLIKPNNHELGEIFNTVLKTDEEIANCARKLQEMGGRNILVSMAGDGALLLDETGEGHRIGCPKGSVQNSVGAGDSMVAGFLAGYLTKQDYSYALKLGTAAGSATAFSIGLAETQEIDQLLEPL